MNNNDTQLRQQALDISQSFIVQAPAGSGKTELLSQRYLALLATVERAPEQILSITFTRKAAAQMRTRLIAHLTLGLQEEPPIEPHSLISWQLAKKVLARDKKEGWGLLENPNRLLIQTIDSLCSSITRKMPYLSRFGAQPSIIEDASSYYQRAAQACLKMIEENDEFALALRFILHYLDNNTLVVENLLIHMLAKREQWLSDILAANQDKTALRTQLEQQLSQLVAAQLVRVNELLSSEIKQEWLSLARYAATQLLQDDPNHPLCICCDVMDFPSTHTDDLIYWQALLNLLFTQQGECRKRVDKSLGFFPESTGETAEEKAMYADMKKRMTTLLTTIADNQSLLTALQDCLYGPAPAYHDNEWQLLDALFTILPITVAHLKKIFQQEGRVDFTEITMAALNALGDEQAPTDLALALDYRISHILVDEFQDTSVSQFRLLEKLTAGWQKGDNRTLFLVGDPMQSIYRFRQADVSLFLQAKLQGIGDIALMPLTLTANFRSQENLVNWNNQIFANLFPKEAQQQAGAIAYSPSIPNKPAHEVSLQFHLCDEITGEANTVVQIIQQTLRDTTGTIAILVRARGHLADILPALQRARINYQATEIEAMSNRAIIQDLAALTRALAYLGDKVAWLSLLRAPWCGLSLADLEIVASGEAATTSIWQRICELMTTDELSIEGKIRLQRFYTIMQYRLAERARQSLRNFVEGTWLALGGPACLTSDSHSRDIDRFWQLLEEFDRHQLPLNSLTLQQAVEKLYASSDKNDAARLFVMTIHKAKGLEFDTVIIPGLAQESRNDNKPLLAFSKQYLDKDHPIFLLAPLTRDGETESPTYQFLWRQERLRADHERVRLLYVAATRAKQQLHLIASYCSDEKKPRAGSFLNQLWPWFLEHSVKQPALENSSEGEDVNSLYRLSLDWQLPVSVMQHFPQPTENADNNNNDLSNTNYNDAVEQLAVSSLIHRVLSQIGQEGAAKWDEARIQFQHRRWLEALTELGVTKEKRHQQLQVVMKTADAILQDTIGHWLLSSHTEMHCNYPIAWKNNHKLMEATIDRLFIDETGMRFIVNYVIEQPSTDQVLPDFLEQHRQKHQIALTNCAQLFAGDHHAIKLGLYFPLIRHWSVWNYSIKETSELISLEPT